MKTPELFKEYIWLVNTIHQAGHISLNDINEKWLQTDMSQGIEMARSTFNRHRVAIEDIFGIIIDCKRRGGYRYYIGNEDVLREDTIQNWMLSTLSVSNVVFESLSLQDRILLETIPAAGTILTKIVETMRKNLRAIIQYRKYGTETTKEVKIEPYCIKLYHRRWYVLAHQEEDEFRVYSFDRILDISMTEETFSILKDFDASEYFWECFGIVKDNDTPCSGSSSALSEMSAITCATCPSTTHRKWCPKAKNMLILNCGCDPPSTSWGTSSHAQAKSRFCTPNGWPTKYERCSKIPYTATTNEGYQDLKASFPQLSINRINNTKIIPHE